MRMLKWLSSEVKMRSLSSRAGSRSPAASGSCRRAGHGVVARNQQGLEVGLAAAGREHAVRGGSEVQAVRGPFDEAALDHGGAGALVPRVQGRVHGRKDRLPHERRNDDRAVQVGGVLGDRESRRRRGGRPLRAPPAPLLYPAAAGPGRPPDAALHVRGSDAGERLSGPLEFGGHGVDPLKHLGHVSRGVAGVEEVVAGGEGKFHAGPKIGVGVGPGCLVRAGFVSNSFVGVYLVR